MFAHRHIGSIEISDAQVTNRKFEVSCEKHNNTDAVVRFTTAFPIDSGVIDLVPASTEEMRKLANFFNTCADRLDSISTIEKGSSEAVSNLALVKASECKGTSHIEQLLGREAFTELLHNEYISSQGLSEDSQVVITSKGEFLLHVSS